MYHLFQWHAKCPEELVSTTLFLFLNSLEINTKLY